MAVVTVSRQLGSGGTYVAMLVARELGYEYLDRQLILAAANRAGAPEVALAQIDEYGLLRLMPAAEAHSAYLRAVATIMLEAAERGNAVIVGRAGQVVLRGVAGVLHVQVVAPIEHRIAAVMRRQNTDKASAERLVHTADRRRLNYLRRNYNADWLDPRLYDLVINTGTLQPQMAARIVVDAVRAVEQ